MTRKVDLLRLWRENILGWLRTVWETCYWTMITSTLLSNRWGRPSSLDWRKRLMRMLVSNASLHMSGKRNEKIWGFSHARRLHYHRKTTVRITRHRLICTTWRHTAIGATVHFTANHNAKVRINQVQSTKRSCKNGLFGSYHSSIYLPLT